VLGQKSSIGLILTLTQDVLAAAGAYFALVQLLSWLISGQATGS
jgi:hypothetical protein